MSVINSPDNNKTHHFRHVQIIFIIGLLVLILYSCSHLYTNYIASQNKLQCDSIRFIMMDRYKLKLISIRESGINTDVDDYTSLLTSIVKDYYDTEITSNGDGTYSCTGLCPSGGTYTFRFGINGDISIAYVECNVENHETQGSW